MMTRRKILSAVAAATAPMFADDMIKSAEAAGQSEKPRMHVPPGACDCHVHVLDPAQFPYSPRRRYTPGPATAEQLRAHLDRLGMQRVVIVQNSVYGSDNRVVTDAIRKFGMERARGVAVIDDNMSPDQLAELDQAGVRGARLNLEVARDENASAAAQTVEKICRRLPKGWHVHINASLPVISKLRDAIMGLDSPVVLDHFAHANLPAGTGAPGFADVIAMLQARRAVVKLSGPYQISISNDYADVASVARAYVAAAPDQLIWGSDWPHTGGTNRPANQPVDVIEPFRNDDDERNLDLLADWAPDSAIRKAILVDAPVRIYGFEPAPA